MTEYERRKIDAELKIFTSRNFEKPSECKNLDQTRFYIQELCAKIEEYQKRFSYVPSWAYGLLAQYNALQNSMLEKELKSNYH